MHILTCVGIVLGAVTIGLSRWVAKLPQWLAILLYVAAIGLIVAGMLAGRLANA